MIDRKKKISEFIAKMEGEVLATSTCLMGGASGNSAGTMSTTNGGDCTNDKKDACNKSKNDGACKNVSGFCNNSTNGSSCNNSIVIPSGPVKNTYVGCK